MLSSPGGGNLKKVGGRDEIATDFILCADGAGDIGWAEDADEKGY